MATSLNPSAKIYIPTTSTEDIGRGDSTAVEVKVMNSFPQMQYLQDELVLFIVSFVADVPYEFSTTGTQSTLTNIVPLLSKSYHSLSKSDILWKNALIRLMTKEPTLWKKGLELFLKQYPIDESSSPSSPQYNEGMDDVTKLVNDAGKAMRIILQSNRGYFSNQSSYLQSQEETNKESENQQNQQEQQPIYIELYRYVLSHYIKFTSPLFYMPDRIILGREFGIHFFEPRYRLLIAEVMSKFPNHYQNGEPIQTNNEFPHYPTFIYAHKSPLKVGTIVTIVEVHQCLIHPNHTADVFLYPRLYGRVEDVWMRPNSHNLYAARVVKLGEDECKLFEYTEFISSRTRLGP